MNQNGEFEAATRTQRGRLAESLAAEYLERRGYEVVARNVEAGGVELDLIARITEDRSDTFVFVEVRSRSSTTQGTPIETIGRSKRARICRGAMAWLVAHDLWEVVAVRFDVIGIVQRPGATPEITWLANAFDASR